MSGSNTNSSGSYLPSHTHTANIDHNPRPERSRPHSHYTFDTILHSAPASQVDSSFESYFDEAFRASPSPPGVSFLGGILNPVEPDPNPFTGYHPPSPAPRRQLLDLISPAPYSMPPSRQRNERNRSLNTFVEHVDLTSDSSPEPAAQRRPKRESPTPGPSAKRLKQNDGKAVRQDNKQEISDANVEEIDLSDDKPVVQNLLQKQREDAVKAQQKPEEKPTTFNTFTCVICMDTPTDLTATACGHLFCHTCLMEALIAGENRAGPGEPKRSQCPVCRKFINRSKSSDIIPLLLKKGLATQPRKKNSVAAAVPTTPQVTS